MGEYIKNVGATDFDRVGALEYGNGQVFVYDETVGLEMPDTIRLEGIFIILCVGGSGRLCINGMECTFGRNDVLVGVPEAVVGPIDDVGSLKIRGLFVSLDYAFKMLPLSVRGWNFKTFFDQNPKITLSERGFNMYNRYWELLKLELADTQNPYRSNVVDALMQAFVFGCRNMFDGIARLSPRPISSAENIFNEFIGLLSGSHPKPRTVAYYADKLNITAKYLSVVCKKVGGKNASKVIDAYVLKDIQNLLRSSKRSVKEISNELAFPNTSFFGRYVKKNLGCTPNELRRRLNGVNR